MTAKRKKKPAKTPRIELQRPSAAPVRWWMHALVVAGLLLANFLLYQRTLGLGFFSLDDGDYVQNNPYIESFNAANLKHILTASYFANYAPANLLSYALDVALAHGKSAFAIHLSNVLWHGFVVCMVYLLAFTIRAEITTAAAAAMLFLLHPAHVEVAAWISSRKDLVATGFAVLAMTCYLRSRREPRHRAWWYAGGLFCFLLASAGKQSVILLPAVMLVWDVVVEKRRGWRMLADKIPFGLITVFFGWMTWQAQPPTNQARSVFVFAGTEFANLWLLTGFGQYVPCRAAPDPAAWSAATRVAIIAAAVLVWAVPWLLHKAGQSIRAASCGWVLINMVPPMVLSFIVPVTDRYLFLPSVGVCLLLADVAGGWARKLPRATWIPWGATAALGLAWCVRTWGVVGDWCDPRSIWYAAHLKTNTEQVAEYLADEYQNDGDRIDGFIKTGAPLQVTNELLLAQAVLGEAARVESLRAEWSGTSPARTSSAAYRDELWKDAWEQYEVALARRGRLNSPNLFMSRGRLLVGQEKFAQAMPEFEKALWFAQLSHFDPVRFGTSTHALYSIGVACWHLGDYKQAQLWLQKAQEVQRKSGQVWLPPLDADLERAKVLAAGQK